MISHVCRGAPNGKRPRSRDVLHQVVMSTSLDGSWWRGSCVASHQWGALENRCLNTLLLISALDNMDASGSILSGLKSRLGAAAARRLLHGVVEYAL